MNNWNQILSEFLINIATGWFGSIFIVPVYSKTETKVKAILLLINLIFAIFSLWLAKEIRSL